MKGCCDIVLLITMAVAAQAVSGRDVMVRLKEIHEAEKPGSGLTQEHGKKKQGPGGILVPITTIYTTQPGPGAWPHLPMLNFVGEQQSGLTECQGDCDTDDQCAGDLQCWQRDEGDTTPGCGGVADSDHDYCVKSDHIQNFGNHGKPADEGKMNRCQGDCDWDAECASGLVCLDWQGAGLSALPGCTGTPTLKDYCVSSGQHPAGTTGVVHHSSAPSESSALLECHGDCNMDSHCAGDLQCWQRGSDDAASPPGCFGSGADDGDYCVKSKYIQDFGVEGKSDGEKLNACQGDCAWDDQCAAGLVCFLRAAGDTTIPPGCLGTALMMDGHDYCVSASHAPLGTKATVDRGPNPGTGLLECEGDCDNDSDCASGLQCWRREADDSRYPPGCFGAGSPDSDYCVKSEHIQDFGNNGKPADFGDGGLMSACQGDCDWDSDCVSGTVCFDRLSGDTSPPPGCTGTAVSDHDYCVSTVHAPAATKPIVFHRRADGNVDFDPHVSGDLQECEGDCDLDSQCAGDLQCWQRDTGDTSAPPGCFGMGVDDMDFCVSSDRIQNFGADGKGDGEKMGSCQGDCDADNECLSGLVCMDWEAAGLSRPRGCIGDAIQKDYCVVPV